MHITDAQRDVRRVFRCGSVGQIVSGFIWLISAALSTWISHRSGMWFLVIGGMFIFPLTQLVLRMTGSKAGLPKGHPMNALAVQVAFIVPFSIPVIAGGALYRATWFFPAFMIIIGAHYLPFTFLYGMPRYGLLAAALIIGGVALALGAPGLFAAPAWCTGIVLIGFGVLVSLYPPGEVGEAKSAGLSTGNNVRQVVCRRSPTSTILATTGKPRNVIIT